jgi:D-3-phosphoglycerate dehydrogenase / 2-oxoglutarate reductase
MNQPQTVVVTDSTFPSLEPERLLLEQVGARLASYQCKSEAEVIDAVRGAKVVLVQFAPISKAVLQVLEPRATVIRYGVGVDNIDLEAARGLDVAVANVPDYCLDEVADHTVAMLLAMLRKLGPQQTELQGGGWNGIAVSRPVLPLQRTTVGFVGLGRIGRSVLERLRPFGCRFVAADPMLTPEMAAQLGVIPLGLDALLEQSDAVSLHSPLTTTTHHLINAQRLARMKSTAIIVNTARGGLIDTQALVAAIKAGAIGGAALDVFEREPLEPNSPLRDLSNVWLTPHMSWYSEDAMGRLQHLAAEEAVRALEGKPLRCPVSLSPG